MSSEQFVNVSYRGIEVGTSLKMIEFGPTTAYVELTTPMPVGTTLDLVTDAAGAPSVAFKATVLRVQEQVAGAEMAPGMRVRAAKLEGDAAAWWKAAVSEADPVIPEACRERVDLTATLTATVPAPEAAAPEPPVVEDEERQPKRTQVMDVSEIQAAIAAGGDIADVAELSDGVPGGADAQPTDRHPSGSNGDPRQPSPESDADDDKKKRKRRRKRK